MNTDLLIYWNLANTRAITGAVARIVLVLRVFPCPAGVASASAARRGRRAAPSAASRVLEAAFVNRCSLQTSGNREVRAVVWTGEGALLPLQPMLTSASCRGLPCIEMGKSCNTHCAVSMSAKLAPSSCGRSIIATIFN